MWGVCSNEVSSCAVCGGEDHRLENCVGPPIWSIGAKDGCPVCNTREHDFDECPNVKRGWIESANVIGKKVRTAGGQASR